MARIRFDPPASAPTSRRGRDGSIARPLFGDESTSGLTTPSERWPGGFPPEPQAEPGTTMTTQRLEDGTHVWLVVGGTVDFVTAPSLAQAIEAAETREPSQRVVVDLDAVTFIDVSGLRVLLNAARRAKDGGHEFAVARPNRHLRRVLYLTAINQSLTLIDSAPPRPDRSPDR
jgi:anti-sigma B factor antagonist